MSRSLLLGCLVLSTATLAADSATRSFKNAADAVEDAFDRTKRTSPTCRENIGRQLDALVDRIDALKQGATDQSINGLKQELSMLGMSAPMAGCPVDVNDDIQKAVGFLEEGRAAMWGNTGRRADDRRNRRHDDEPVFTQTERFVQMAPLTVQPNARFEGENAVRVVVPELKIFNMQGKPFSVGARFRSYEGQWSDWVTTQTWAVPNDAFVWKNAFNHFFRYSSLAEDDFSQGRFIAHVSVFDGDGRELAFREASFKVRLPQLPSPGGPGPVGVPPVLQARDCGPGADIGCTITRDGQYPMDAQVFAGVLESLRSWSTETMRAQSVQVITQRQYLTAAQLGAVLDLFRTEELRLQAARFAAPRVVNPQHSLGLAAKFRTEQYGQAFLQLMSEQPPGGMPGTQPPPVVLPNAPPPPPVQGPPQAYRDCGTGSDPGCTMWRKGRQAADAPTFAGVLTVLRSNANELTRAEVANTMIGSHWVTAAQLGLVLDLFSNELVRLDVAKRAAEHVVNPQHALALAAKFQNSFNAQELVEVMSRQR